MRVQLWCDMEGVAGITKWEQVNGGAPQYEEGRRLYMGETNAVIRACKRAGAEEIVAIDGHGAGKCWTFNSWIHQEMEDGAEYITGYPWGCYVEGFKKGTVDAVLLPGAHARAGTPSSVLCHTISSTNWVNAYINGKPVGESGLVAAIAGSFGVPCIFVSGDHAACEEAKDFISPNIVTASVKQSLGRYSARSLSHGDACRLIEQKVEEALADRSKWPAPLEYKDPELRIELHTPEQVPVYTRCPGVEVIGDRTLVYKAKDFWTLWDNFWPWRD